jgi:predicted HTH transcriptional regulator
MTEEEFMELLSYGREQRGVEFKGPGSKTGNKQLFAKVVRAVLSMANNRNGGLVIIGVAEDEHGKPVPSGISELDLATWDYDEIADSFAQYADPSINFDTEIVEFKGNKFIVINVHEFEDIPILCKKEYQGVLREGACYIRTRRKPETAEIPTQTEMRDLLDLAIIKNIRKYLSIAYTAGLEVSETTKQNDEELFNKQLGDLLEE